jgi:hypothetical protein
MIYSPPSTNGGTIRLNNIWLPSIRPNFRMKGAMKIQPTLSNSVRPVMQITNVATDISGTCIAWHGVQF